MASAESINPGFSTADADYPSIHFDCWDLTLHFLDWREKKVTVVFRETVCFQWVTADVEFEDEPYDGACIIKDSSWLPKSAEAETKHYRLNFNGIDCRLDVGCQSIEVKTE